MEKSRNIALRWILVSALLLATLIPSWTASANNNYDWGTMPPPPSQAEQAEAYQSYKLFNSYITTEGENYQAPLVIGGSTGYMVGAPVQLSYSVTAYYGTIAAYAETYGIGEYTSLAAAVMMQESDGIGGDPMQASECGYNTAYSNDPNSITDPDYSINIGMHELADCLSLAGVQSPSDIEHITLALQGYNFGAGYISWALEKYGGYSAENAAEFSLAQAAKCGWSSYGDVDYVPHVLRYYTYELPGYFSIPGQEILEVASSEVGYHEGSNGYTKYGSWFGMPNEQWCAMFVAWCANERGYVDSGVVPLMAASASIEYWYASQGLFVTDVSLVPDGSLIIFDFNGDGAADHIGIVECVADGTVYTIEGNTADAVARMAYPTDLAAIRGYCILPNLA